MLLGPSPAAGWKVRALGALVVGLVTSAPGLAAAPAFVAAAVRPHHVFLWEVATSDDSMAKLYLLGAMHAGRARIERFDPVIEAAFERSDVLAVEANVAEADVHGVQQLMLAKGTIDDGTALHQWLPASLNVALQRTLSEQRSLESAYEPLEPWFVSLILSADDYARSGYRQEFGTEGYFMQRAANRKRIEELEGARRQIELLDALPRKVQNLMLEQTLEGLGGSESRAREIEAIWEAGDAGKLAAFLFAGKPDPSRQIYLEHMYFARNRAMAARLESSLAEPGVWFAVVGAGHLVGAQGIPALLARAGYRVRHVEASSPTELIAQLASE